MAGLVSVGGAITTVSILRQLFTEFEARTASAFHELWKKEGEQDVRLNTIERRHEGLEREHNILTREVVYITLGRGNHDSCSAIDR